LDKRVQAVLFIVERDYRRGVCCADLAAAVGLCISRLERLFKDATQNTIRDFVRRRRVEEAAQHLTTTQLRISEVARNVGFADATNFTHAFKNHYGVSPREYRIENLQIKPIVIKYDKKR
jgi:transcriptional regulator GlxA family with amidase domain